MSNPDAYNLKPGHVVMYSASWCPDCKRARAFFIEHNIEFLDIDLGKDIDGYLFVEGLTRRVRVPTIIFPDAAILIEPSNEALAQQLGVKNNA